MVFVWKKYGLNEINDIKLIQNKIERRRVKIKERKWEMKFNGKVKSSREIKRQKWRGKVGGREEEFFIFYFFIRIGRWKV